MQRLFWIGENVLHRASGGVFAADGDLGVLVDLSSAERLHDLETVFELTARAFFAHPWQGQRVHAEDDVLGGFNVRLAVGGRQQVVCGEHLNAGFGLRVRRQRDVNRHLIAVKIRVEGLADERVELNGLTFHQQRREGLNTEAVQGRGAVEQHDFVLNHFLQSIPNLVPRVAVTLEHLAGALDVGDDALLLENLEEEGFEQFERHALGESALVQFELRPDDDHRATGVVDALAEQVLTEPSLLAAQEIGQATQSAIRAGVRDGRAATTVVDQRIHGFLQHALLVADDHLGRTGVEQLFEAVVAVDEAAVQIVQIRRGEAPAIDLHHRAQVWWHHRHGVQNHPLGAIARLPERACNLETLTSLRPLVATRVAHLLLQHRFERLEIDAF